MFFAIINQGEMNRKYPTTFGLTTKRDLPKDSKIIGEFGTGIKFAVVAAIRLGLSPVISSTDKEGTYQLRFIEQEIEVTNGNKQKFICLEYHNLSLETGEVTVEKKDWSVMLQSFPQWDEPVDQDDAKAFKVLREFICNAYDEDEHFLLEDCSADCLPFALPGETIVYLRKTEDTEMVLNNPAKYFKFLLQDARYLVVDGLGRIYEKSDQLMSRIFVRGVLISCVKDIFRRSSFDYDLHARGLLSEDRKIKEQVYFYQELGRLIGNINHDKILAYIFETVITDRICLESSVIKYLQKLETEARARWLKTAVKYYKSEKICVASSSRITDQDVAQIYNYQVVEKTSVSIHLLHKLLGFPMATDISPVQPGYSLLRLSDLDKRSRKNFLLAYGFFARAFPDRVKIPVSIYLSDNENMRNRIAGVAGMGDEIFAEAWISAISPTELRSPMAILQVLIHETRHVITKAYDYDRAFVQKADEEIVRLLMLASGRTYDLDGKYIEPFGADVEKPNLVEPKIIYLDDKGDEIPGDNFDDINGAYEALLNSNIDVAETDKPSEDEK